MLNLCEKTTMQDICFGKGLVRTVHGLLYAPELPISVVLLPTPLNFCLSGTHDVQEKDESSFFMLLNYV